MLKKCIRLFVTRPVAPVVPMNRRSAATTQLKFIIEYLQFSIGPAEPTTNKSDGNASGSNPLSGVFTCSADYPIELARFSLLLVVRYEQVSGFYV